MWDTSLGSTICFSTTTTTTTTTTAAAAAAAAYQGDLINGDRVQKLGKGWIRRGWDRWL